MGCQGSLLSNSPNLLLSVFAGHSLKTDDMADGVTNGPILTSTTSSSNPALVQSDNHDAPKRPSITAELDSFHCARDRDSHSNDGGEDDAKTYAVVEKPFADLQLSPHDSLRSASRMKCPGKCGKKRRYYCSDCIIPLLGPSSSIPVISLPLHVHILQAASESPQQSTAQHVPLLAPRFATIWRPYPECMQVFQNKVLEKAEPNSIAILYVFYFSLLLRSLYSVTQMFHNVPPRAY